MAALNNAVRMAPQEYRDTYMLDHPRDASGILLPENFSPVAPLIYLEGLNRSARYHTNDLAVTQCGYHHYSCDGTPASTRVNSFLSPPCNYYGEVLHVSFGEPRRQVNEWLCVSATGDDCVADGGVFHREMLMSSGPAALGIGIYSVTAGWPYCVVQDYANCSPEFRPPLVDGSHIFFGGEILFMATYFDSPGYPPREVVLVLDGAEHAMDLDIGRPEAGTYGVSIVETGQCRSYYFRATTSAGLTYRYPASGQLQTVGDGCTEAWVP
jgi:hypothetical protein